MHLFCKLQYVVQRKFCCCTSFPSNSLLKYDVEYTRDIAVISQSDCMCLQSFGSAEHGSAQAGQPREQRHETQLSHCQGGAGGHLWAADL